MANDVDEPPKYDAGLFGEMPEGVAAVDAVSPRAVLFEEPVDIVWLSGSGSDTSYSSGSASPPEAHKSPEPCSPPAEPEGGLIDVDAWVQPRGGLAVAAVANASGVEALNVVEFEVAPGNPGRRRKRADHLASAKRVRVGIATVAAMIPMVALGVLYASNQGDLTAYSATAVDLVPAEAVESALLIDTTAAPAIGPKTQESTRKRRLEERASQRREKRVERREKVGPGESKLVSGVKASVARARRGAERAVGLSSASAGGASRSVFAALAAVLCGIFAVAAIAVAVVMHRRELDDGAVQPGGTDAV